MTIRRALPRGETEVPAIAYLNLRVSTANIWLLAETIDPGQIDALMDALTDYYNTFPGMRAFASRGSIHFQATMVEPAASTSILPETDLADIFRVAELARDRAETLVRQNPRLDSSPSSLSLDQPLVEIRPHWERARRNGHQWFGDRFFPWPR